MRALKRFVRDCPHNHLVTMNTQAEVAAHHDDHPTKHLSFDDVVNALKVIPDPIQQ